MSSVCYPSKSVFPAQDVSDDTHPELSAFFAFQFQFSVNARVQGEEGRKKSDEEEGKKQREQLNSHSHGADCCPR